MLNGFSIVIKNPKDSAVEHQYHERLRRRTLQAGEYVFREGEPGDFAYIIEQGQVEISTDIDGQRFVLTILEPGTMFGELALVDGRARSASAIARRQTLLTLVTKRQVEERIHSADPILRMLLLVVLRYLRIEASRFRPKSQNSASEEIVFDPQADLVPRIAQAVDLIRMETELQQAIQAQQLQLLYQPIVDLTTGRMAGFEALIRWHSPTRGFVRPDHFIPLAESTSLIIPIGYWVIETACRDLQQIRQQTGENLFVSINVASRQIEEPDLLENLMATAQGFGIRAQQLKLEILERSLIDSNQATHWVQRCRDMGFPLSLDDFGTGYSSLEYLCQYQFDTLKIDKSFVRELETNPNTRSICKAIIDLSDSLGITVVAEGVEYESQQHILNQMGCTFGQGYLFSKPLPLVAAIDLLKRQLEVIS
jgi:EAL domain-containing protein (putative c-di-GMP-specific phosphodiesterase class I)